MNTEQTTENNIARRTTTKRTIAFREIHSVGEVMEMFKLLRSAYSETEIPDNDDRRSTHFGLFDVTSITCSRLIGCLRVVHAPGRGAKVSEIGRVALNKEYRNAGLAEFIADCAQAWTFREMEIPAQRTISQQSYAHDFQTFGCVRKVFEINDARQVKQNQEKRNKRVNVAA